MPIIGSLGGCCARTRRGHAAAPPTSVMNSRRFTMRLLWNDVPADPTNKVLLFVATEARGELAAKSYWKEPDG
jgi:hypothetical protein